MSNEHPKALAAHAAAELNQAIRNAERATIAHAKAKHGVRFLTVGNYTICYRIDRRSVIELSTAIKHPNDRFNRHVGQLAALQRFAANNRILLKNEQGFSPKQFLQLTFSILQ